MQSLTYKDIIDDKITEWQSGLQKIETLTEKATSDAKTRLSSQLRQAQVNNRFRYSAASSSGRTGNC